MILGDKPLISEVVLSHHASNLNFYIHSLEEESTIASPIVRDILQEVKIKQEKEHVMNKLDIVVFKPIKCAENIFIHPISDTQDELNLLSSSNTLCYIEFDVFCDLNNLKDKLLLDSDVQWLTRNTCHVMGRYNCIGDYMVHRVYIFFQKCNLLWLYNNMIK
jgi:hypothetical protein